MKWAAASLAVLLGVGLVGVSLQAVTIGFGIGYEVSGLVLISALTRPPFSTGLAVEGGAGLRAAPFNVVQLFLQACYLLRRSGTGWNAGPVLEGGLLVQF